MGPSCALPIYRGAVLFMDVQQICPDLPICTHPVIAAIRRISWDNRFFIIGYSLPQPVWIACRTFDCPFPQLNPQKSPTPPSVCSMVSCQYFPFWTLFPLFLRFLLLSHILWHMARSLPIINLKNKGTSTKCPFVYIQTTLNIFKTQSFPSLEKCSISNPLWR